MKIPFASGSFSYGLFPIRWLAIFAAGTCLSLLSPSVSNAGPGEKKVSKTPHVDIFRGLGGYMPASKQLQKQLAERGVSSKTWLSANAGATARSILARRASGDRGPIVLMGYAVGGGGTRKVAEILGKQGIMVDAIILIDPSFFEPVPANVRYCFVAHRPEIWQTWNSIMRGNPVKAESGKTRVVHVNLKEADKEHALAGEMHITITGNEWVQELLVREAVKAAR